MGHSARFGVKNGPDGKIMLLARAPIVDIGVGDYVDTKYGATFCLRRGDKPTPQDSVAIVATTEEIEKLIVALRAAANGEISGPQDVRPADL